MRSYLVALIVAITALPATAADKYWVTSDTLNRRTCPDTSCGIVGRLLHRESVQLLEAKGGWARISKYYDASCRNGRSQYVDSGNARCAPNNGISNGKFAEWVSMQHLSVTRPVDPATGATGLKKAVLQSDHASKHGAAFEKASRSLVAAGRCTVADFQEMGGWVKATGKYRDRPVYFTYCGGFSTSHRIYLDVATGRTFR